MQDLKKALFLCHRDGLSHAGTTKFIFDDMAERFNIKNIEPHCIITGHKPNSSKQYNFIPGRITHRESFLKESFSQCKVDSRVYQEIVTTLLSDSNFILIFERNNPFSSTKGLFNQFPMLERLVSNIIGFYDDLNPKYVFSFAVPHHFINYCLLRVAELMGIKVYFCDIGAFPWQYQLYEGLFKREKIKNTLQLEDGKQKVKEWFDNQNQSYTKSISSYEESGGLGVLHGRSFMLLDRFILISRLFKDNVKSGYTIFRNFKAIIKAQTLKFYSDRLKRKIAQRPSVDLDTFPYIIFFMHFQPEATTMPNGSHYANQLFAIRELSLAAPSDWKILVREHPFTFENEFSPRYRNEELYEAIDDMEGVQLMSLEYDPYILIDKSEAIATLTGTVGFQAICRGRPVITFGKAAYQGVHGVVSPENNFDLKQYLHKINNSSALIDSKQVLNSLYKLEQEGFGDLMDDESPYSSDCRHRALNTAFQFWLEEII
mgnify:CR=1 FL=1|tara:strand:- start:6855 stop:8315 length:1461 start_codon:yes stop_codon:yes gene_type:complete